MYAYGSDANLHAAEYGEDYLHLPDGVKYIEKNVDKYGVIEHVRQFENVRPQGTFEVTEKIDDLTLCAAGIDFNLTDQLLGDGVEVMVTFRDGGLSGYDLAIENGSWNNERKLFKLVGNREENALEVPGAIHFNVGDHFILTGLKMPQSYIDKAEQELLTEAQRWLDEKCENRVQPNAVCDEIYFAEEDVFIACGQMIGIYNAKLAIDREIRVTAVKRYIERDDENPYRYEITISDFLQGNGLSRIINDIKDIPNQIERESSRNKQYTRRQFRDAIELGNALQEAFKNYSEGIDPVYVRTMQLIAGDERLQYRFVNNPVAPTEVDQTFEWNHETGIFSSFRTNMSSEGAIIQHMTLGIDSMKPSHVANEYRYWRIPNFSIQIPDTKARWVYIRCSKTTEEAIFKVSEAIIEMESEAGYYHFVAGYLNSEYEGHRSFAILYGFTEILPGQIRVNKIISNDGTNYWDMVSKTFKIGNDESYVSWNVDKADRLAIKGTIMQSGTKVQNPDGETDFIGIDRGYWNAGVTYYPGDTVKLTYDENVYKCRMQNKGLQPNNAPTYWKLMISKGADGSSVRQLYLRSTAQPATPAGNTPSGWSSNPPSGTTPLWMSKATFKADGTIEGVWSVPVRISGTDGQNGTPGQGYMYAYYASDLPTYTGRPSTPGVIPSGWTASPDFKGMKYIYVSQSIQTNGVWSQWSAAKIYSVYPEPGDPGPAVVFRGEWAAPKIFYNNAARRDVIRFGGTYYIYKGVDGTTETEFDWSKWDTFGAQFDSVATGLLLAENANIAGWIFQNQRLYSQDGKSWMNGKTGEFNLGAGNFTVDNSGNVTIKGEFESTANISRYTENKQVENVKQTIEISSQNAKVDVHTSDNETAYMSSQGIFANRAGVESLSATTGVSLKGAIVGLGFGKMDNSAWGGNWGIAGVIGRASNSSSNPAPSWGGYFDKLRANGLYLGCRQIEVSTYLTETDCYVTAYNKSDINVYLPPKPQIGQVILIRRMNTPNVTVQGNGIGIHVDGNVVTSKNAGAARGDMGVYIYDGQYWAFNYWIR